MRISVNNKDISVSGQRPLIEELREMGIMVPSMCYAEGKEHQPSCMVCMVKDVRTGQMIPSCSTMPYEGMQIETDSDEVKELRRLSLELLLSDHRADCEGPCTIVCQRGIDVAGVINLYDLGRLDEARELLGGVSCEGCKAPCEKACRRSTVDEGVKIREILSTLNTNPSTLNSNHSLLTTKLSTPTSKFNSRLGRFTDKEKLRLKEIYTQPSHCLHCACDGKEKCKLRKYATEANIKVTRYGLQSSLPVKEQIPVTGHLVYEPAKCIRCGLCVYNTNDGFTFERRGFDMRVVIPEESKKHISEKIAELCPTGALVLKLLLPLLVLLTGCRSLPESMSINAELPEHPKLLWEHRHNVRTVASPAAYNGMVLTCDKHGQMVGLDEETGEQRLSLALGSDMEASFTIEDSMLYVGMLDGKVRSLSLPNGSEQWNFATEGQILAKPTLTSNPSPSALFIGSYDNYMYTLSLLTGKLINRVETGNYINGAAVLWKDYVLFGGYDSWVRIVNGTTGIPADSLKLDAYIPASPVVDGDNVYVADYRGNVYELTLADGGRIMNHRKLLSAAEDDGGMLSVPVVTEDALYLLTTDRRLMCLDRKDGKEKWFATLKGDTGECSPILVDNRLLVCTKTGIVSIHEVSTGRQLWEYETGEQIIAQPLVIGSHFYIQTARGTLLCFGEREE